MPTFFFALDVFFGLGLRLASLISTCGTVVFFSQNKSAEQINARYFSLKTNLPYCQRPTKQSLDRCWGLLSMDHGCAS
jgi:hypothetical protein